MSRSTMRLLRDAEKALLTHLIVGTPQAAHLLSSLSDALVEEMSDGGMGGYAFVLPMRSRIVSASSWSKGSSSIAMAYPLWCHQLG